MFRFLSLGAGVQSSTVALKMKHGEIEPVYEAIFADTGQEPRAVYDWLDWLEKQLPFPVVRVSAGDLSEATFRMRVSRNNGRAYLKNFIPSYSIDQDTGERGVFPRKCTSDFKMVPIYRELRRVVKPRRGETRVLAESVIGISWDEVHRMKPAWYPWLRNAYPLVDLHLTRGHCLEWMRAQGYPRPPRSACVFCPYHSDKEWLHLKQDSPEEFEKAVQFERRLWASAASRNVKTREFLHPDRMPLDQVEFKEDRNFQLFGNECEGMCGV